MPNIDVPAAYEQDPLGYALTQVAPEIGGPAAGFVQAVYQHLNLPLRVAEAARYRTAMINGCIVCQNFRAADHLDNFLKAGGGDPESSLVARGGERPDEAFYQAIANWRESDQFTSQEQLAIEYSEKMALYPDETAYDAEFWQRMKSAFSDREITELTLAIGSWMALGRLTHILGLDTQCLTDSLNQAA